MPESEVERTFEQQFVDELMPEEMDWEDVVSTYPLFSLAVAAVAGFVIGRRSGRMIMSALSDSAVERVTGMVDQLLQKEP